MKKLNKCPSSWTLKSVAPSFSSAMKNVILVVFLSFGPFMTMYGQTLDWAKGIGGTSYDFTNGMTLDNANNVYIIGSFSGTVDFDPGPGVVNLTIPQGDASFFAKYSSSGELVWAKSIGSISGSCSINDIAVDSVGNVYITGSCDLNMDFDPGPSVVNLTTTGIFFAKYDQSGNYVWAKGIGQNQGSSIAVDDSSNVYVTGYFTGTVDFDPGPGVSNLTAVGNYDIFFAKYDQSGNYVWAKGVGGSSYDEGLSISIDDSNNVYIAGTFASTVDFDPGLGVVNLTGNGGSDIFFAKYDQSGNYVWAKKAGGIGNDHGRSIAVDDSGNVYITGFYGHTVDFDPGPGVVNLTGAGNYNIFFAKYDQSGNYVWAKSVGGSNINYSWNIAVDVTHNVYITGSFQSTTDFDPGSGVSKLTSTSGASSNNFFAKYDQSGNYVWAKKAGGTLNGSPQNNGIAVNNAGDVYVAGYFSGTVDFDPGPGTVYLTPHGNNIGIEDIFILKLRQKGIYGIVYNDLNQNCLQDINESGLSEHTLIIQPGNYLVQTNECGIFSSDSLAPGNYTATIDTTNHLWLSTCFSTQSFVVTNSNTLIQTPAFGLVSTQPCSDPNISIYAPSLRRCFSNQTIYVTACNQITATGILDSAYADVQLDPLLTIQSSSLPYVVLGSNLFRFDLGNLNPGQCVSWTIFTQVSCSAILGQTLCMEATLYPIESCVFDSVPSLPPGPTGGVSPCTLPWDHSSLQVNGWCQNDSIYFTITNTGDPIDGDMDCFAPVRVYIDGIFIQLDSIQLTGGQVITYIFAGTGQTWRLEADQHPLHPGNSHPNAVVELCGDILNWTPGLVNIQYQDDATPVVDIYCGTIVTGSYDPNDKTGYPTGVGNDHYVYPNQQLQYAIRFQNTGNDTAFTVVIRDTLDPNLNIFTVTTGIASHPYTFQMYGQRVLEWRFDNILLPDSNINEPASHGFVTFTADQNMNLPFGTEIFNEAGIYFDFNAPVITNQTLHTLYDFEMDIITDVQSIPFEDNSFHVYPNPASTQVYLEFPVLQEQSEIVLMNMLGQKMYSTDVDKGIDGTTIAVERFPKGIYFVMLNSSKKVSSKKLVIY